MTFQPAKVEVGTSPDNVLVRFSPTEDDAPPFILGISWEVALEMARQLIVTAREVARVQGIHPDVFGVVAQQIRNGANEGEKK